MLKSSPWRDIFFFFRNSINFHIIASTPHGLIFPKLHNYRFLYNLSQDWNKKNYAITFEILNVLCLICALCAYFKLDINCGNLCQIDIHSRRAESCCFWWLLGVSTCARITSFNSFSTAECVDRKRYVCCIRYAFWNGQITTSNAFSVAIPRLFLLANRQIIF